MKKSWKIICGLVLAAVLSLSLCACDAGLNGLSAYELAVKNGFEGTEQEWLESISHVTVIEKDENHYNVNLQVGDLSLAANTGLKSIVSVYSTFTKNTSAGWPFFQQPQQTNYTVTGAGVFYQVETDGSAYVITNHHVVYDSESLTSNKISDSIKLFLYGMESNDYGIPATYVGGSMYYDIAVLRVENSDIVKAGLEKGTLSAVQFGDSERVIVGQSSVAIGNPAGEGISVSGGLISVDSEYITMTAVDNRTTITLRVMRTDTAVNSGNSGGGLFDANGKLIGIVNAKMNTSNAENIAYAIPCNLMKAVADNIIYYCTNSTRETVMRPTLGITTEVAEMSTALDPETGMIVKIQKLKISEVANKSLAKEVLQVGDVVESITLNETRIAITHSYLISETLLTAKVGDVVTFEIIRDGEKLTKEITVTEDCLSAY